MTRRPPKRVGATIVLAAALLSSGSAQAEARRVLFEAPRGSPFGVRIRAEIAAMGFEVEPIGTLVDEVTGSVVAAARVIEEPPPVRIELWIVDEASHKLVRRSVIELPPDEDSIAPSVRASEQLRAFFEPLQPAAPPSPADNPWVLRPLTPKPVATEEMKPKPAEPPKATAPLPMALGPIPRPHFAVSLGVGTTFALDTPSVDVPIRIRWMAHPRIAIGAMVDLPAMGSTVEGAEGKATMRSLLVGPELSGTIVETRYFTLRGNMGAALAWLSTSGTTVAPYTGKSRDGFIGVGLLGAELAPRLSKTVYVYLGGHAGVATAKVEVAFAGRAVGNWGRPLGQVAAGAGVEF